MTYFTILHWLAMAIIGTFFIVILILTMRNSDETFPLPAVLTNLLVTILIGGFTIYGLDKYTKIAQLENISQQKILLNESFSIGGQIRNIGNFNIGKCVLDVTIANELSETNGETPLFLPKSIFDVFFKKSGSSDFKVDTHKEFVIAENLREGEVRNFNVFMRYPASFGRPYTRYKLFCH